MASVERTSDNTLFDYRGPVRSEYKLLGILVSMDPPRQNILQFNEQAPQVIKKSVVSGSGTNY